jgi:hypothetical protein
LRGEWRRKEVPASACHGVGRCNVFCHGEKLWWLTVADVVARPRRRGGRGRAAHGWTTAASLDLN